MLAAPIGRLTQNTSDQCMCSTIKAPSAAPRIAEMPKTLELKPCTFARSAGV